MSAFPRLRRPQLSHRPRPSEGSHLAVGDGPSHLQKAVQQVLEGKG